MEGAGSAANTSTVATAKARLPYVGVMANGGLAAGREVAVLLGLNTVVRREKPCPDPS